MSNSVKPAGKEKTFLYDQGKNMVDSDKLSGMFGDSEEARVRRQW